MAEKDSEARRKRVELWKSALFRWLVFGQLLVLFLFAYVKLGNLLVTQTNFTPKDIYGGDQMHNMRLATETRPDLNADFTQGVSKAITDFFPHRTDGIVHPLWPWVAAWLVEPGHVINNDTMATREVSDQDFKLFNQGRWLNIFFTAVFLVFLGIAACRIFSFPAACNLLLLGGFGALLPRSAYFQPEPLFFVLFFLTWVACICALKQNTLWMYALIGVLSGAAYMAKGSVQPLLAVFVFVSTLRCFWEILFARRRGMALAGSNQWHWQNHFIGLVMLALTHLLTIGPRLTDSHEKFGSMFHSYPGYWMWFDTFGGAETIDDPKTAYGWMDKHNTKEELLAMRPEDKPSLTNYLRTHTKEQVAQRLWDGSKSKFLEFVTPKQTKRAEKIEKQRPWRGILEARGWYLGALTLILLSTLVLLFFAAPKAQHVGHAVFRHGTISVALFVILSFVGFTLAYGWYTPIGRGDRFMMSLYLPMAFSLIWGAESIVRRIKLRYGSPWISRAYLLTQWVLFAVICWRLFEIYRTPQFYNG